MTTEEMLVSLVENVKNINSTLNNMNKQFDDINNQIAEMKTDIQNVKALTVENEKEMALIRINMMESEIRRIKEKLA